jgi:hypothetical protein
LKHICEPAPTASGLGFHKFGEKSGFIAITRWTSQAKIFKNRFPFSRQGNDMLKLKIMTVHDKTIGKIRQLPESLVQEVSDFYEKKQNT